MDGEEALPYLVWYGLIWAVPRRNDADVDDVGVVRRGHCYPGQIPWSTGGIKLFIRAFRRCFATRPSRYDGVKCADLVCSVGGCGSHWANAGTAADP